TAVGVAPPAAPIDQALAGGSHLDVFPRTIALSSEGGRQQLRVSIVDEADLTSASTGTRYFVGDERIASVGPDGLVTALAAGDTVITVIHGRGEVPVPLHVEAPRSGPVKVGVEGGVVRGADGSEVLIGPGTLAAETTVSIRPLAESDLTLPVPDGFEHVGAFALGLDLDALSQPVQVAVPTSGLDPGTPVWFWQLVKMPTGN